MVENQLQNTVNILHVAAGQRFKLPGISYAKYFY